MSNLLSAAHQEGSFGLKPVRKLVLVLSSMGFTLASILEHLSESSGPLSIGLRSLAKAAISRSPVGTLTWTLLLHPGRGSTMNSSLRERNYSGSSNYL